MSWLSRSKSGATKCAFSELSVFATENVDPGKLSPAEVWSFSDSTSNLHASSVFASSSAFAPILAK